MKFKEWYELREQKDACYHKVKSRYKVWPSAYASGALVRCRKVGAKNWGNSQEESSNVSNAIDRLHEGGIDVAKTSFKEMKEALANMGINPPDGMSIGLFVLKVNEGVFDLEKERGLRGWFDRNNGKGWIDCRKSRKGNLVPCGRKKAGKGAERKYPACRPNLSACNKKGTRRKKGSKRVSWE